MNILMRRVHLIQEDESIIKVRNAAQEALYSRRLLQAVYNGEERLLDVHVIGFNSRLQDIMHVWQMPGDKIFHQPSGWRLMYLHRITHVEVTDKPSNAPRLDFKREKCGVGCIEHEAGLIKSPYSGALKYGQY